MKQITQKVAVFIIFILTISCQSTNNAPPQIGIEVEGTGQFFDGEKSTNDYPVNTSENKETENKKATACPHAPKSRVKEGDRARVTTDSERLIVRTGGNINSDEVSRLYSGTYLTIIGGPKCSGGWTYWRIRTDSGVEGWVAEGGNTEDEYFIEPIR